MEAAAEFFSGNDVVNGDHFVVEDLLDFSNDDDAMDTDGAGFDAVNDLSPVSAVNECSNSSTFSGFEQNFADGTIFSGDLCVPCDDVAELEWLSNFVEESFSSEDQQKLQLLSGFSTRPESRPNTRPEPFNDLEAGEAANRDMLPVRSKARSKRSRSEACNNWASNRLVVVDPAGNSPGGENSGGGGRRCRHCSTEKTPQWRTGPDGPKTLCNACGVRYKSGRLVPEYRPAASPTFMQTKHSNSHRKVMELRRQKERFVMARELHDTVFDDLVEGSNGGDCFLIHHHHVGPEFAQLL